MGLTNDLVPLGIGLGVIVIGFRALGTINPATDSQTGQQPGQAAPTVVNQVASAVASQVIAQAGQAATTAVVNTWVNAVYGGNVTQAINASIDAWFQRASGVPIIGNLIGAGPYDPTDWNAFRNGAYPVEVRALLPANSTGYFQAKVAQYQNRGYTTPGGLGY